MKKCLHNIAELSPRVGITLSYIICINTCAFTRNCLKITLWYFLRSFYHSVWLINLFNLMSYSIMFFCGCLMDYLVHRYSILHASLSVILGVAFTYLISGINSNEYILLLNGVVTGAVLGAIGGACVVMMRKIISLKNNI
ncbi:hypothetical protein AH716_004586 [Salmonella enterica subsp. enterica]|nr:hypothetical protein [Salmonella enterica subsp. enterica serovar Gbadago]